MLHMPTELHMLLLKPVISNRDPDSTRVISNLLDSNKHECSESVFKVGDVFYIKMHVDLCFYRS